MVVLSAAVLGRHGKGELRAARPPRWFHAGAATFGAAAPLATSAGPGFAAPPESPGGRRRRGDCPPGGGGGGQGLQRGADACQRGSLGAMPSPCFRRLVRGARVGRLLDEGLLRSPPLVRGLTGGASGGRLRRRRSRVRGRIAGGPLLESCRESRAAAWASSAT